MIALVRSVIEASIDAGSRQKKSGSMSANTGVAPVRATELPVAAKVNDGTMTSSPGPMPAARRPKCSPDVPEFTATQVRPCTSSAANSSSNALTSGPWAIIPDRRTRSTASRSSSPTIGFAAGIMGRLISPPPLESCHLGSCRPARSAGSARGRRRERAARRPGRPIRSDAREPRPQVRVRGRRG